MTFGGQRYSTSGDASHELSLFRDLGANDRQDIIGFARRVKRSRGERLFRQGASAQQFYLLQEGRVKLTRITPDGQLVLLRFVVPGEAFGGVAALGNRTYPVSAEAAADCIVLAWNGRTMLRLLRQHAQLAINLIDLLSERLHDMQARYEELATEQVEQRLARILLRLVKRTGRRVERGVLVDVRLSRQELADMTGTSLFTVSRILKRWEKAGVIESRRQRILVRHPHGLVSIAEDLPPIPDGQATTAYRI
jgi:CRP-like cAMP-binding protein